MLLLQLLGEEPSHPPQTPLLHSRAGRVKSGINVALRQPERSGSEAYGALGALWLIAVCTVAGGAVWSGTDGAAAAARRRQRQRGGAGDSSADAAEDGTAVITMRGAVTMMLFSSAFLVGLFFLLSRWVVLALVLLFALGGWQALAVLLTAAAGAMTPLSHLPALRLPTLSLPLLGLLSPLELGGLVVSAGVTGTWLACRGAGWAWGLQDVLSVALMLLILRQIHLPNLKVRWEMWVGWGDCVHHCVSVSVSQCVLCPAAADWWWLGISRQFLRGTCMDP
jgi:signal peptide peptidase-like protein 2B